MGTYTWLVGLGLLAQVGSAPLGSAPLGSAPLGSAPLGSPPAQPAASAQPPHASKTPPALLGEALTPPARSPLAGQPLRLVDLLARSNDRTRQLQAVRIYWTLSAAVASYYSRRSEFDFLARLEGFESAAAETAQPAGETVRLDGALALVEAQAREAELAAIDRQYELAPWLGAAVVTALPLPADMPQIGQYRTNFEQIFAGRAAPEPARRAHDTLPLRFREIELRAAAVQTLNDLLSASEEAYVSGRAPREQVVERLQELSRERQEFIQAVLAYNFDITDYALAVARRGAPANELAAMLVPGGSNTPQAQPAATAPPPAQPAAAMAPPPAAPRSGRRALPGRQMTYEEPLLGAPGMATQPGPLTAGQPTPGDPASGWQPREEGTPPAEEPPAELPIDPDADPIEIPDAAEPPEAATPETMEEARAGRNSQAARIVLVAQRAASDPTPPAGAPLYQSLVEINPMQRAQELATQLALSAPLPPAAGSPITLDACVQAVSARDRSAVTSTYWQARSTITEYGILQRQLEQFAALESSVLALHDRVGGAEAMLEFRAMRLVAEAELTRAHASSIVAQAALPRTAALAGARLLPVTAPHGGRYAMRLELFPANIQSSGPVVRLAAAMPRWFAAVAARAEEVVAADLARARLTDQLLREPALPGPAMRAIRQQARATLGFNDTVTRYNMAIGEYAAVVLPPNLPAAQYVAALVLSPAGTVGRM
ncbi:MAG: hypothetical protein K1X74_16170 [Pirellulales bacterium]|nr:hypothetical protein [Pirellulales bacterium]